MNKLWMLLLSLLGFAGCDEPQEDMYGTPYAEYTVKGRVTDAAGTPIAASKCGDRPGGSDPSAVRTDTRGAYTFEADGNVLYMPPVLTFTDTDGPAGGGDFAGKRSRSPLRRATGRARAREVGCTGVSSARASTSYSRRKPERSSMDGTTSFAA